MERNHPHYDGCFLKFTVAVVTSNEQAKIVAKALEDRWFYTYGIPLESITIRANNLTFE